MALIKTKRGLQRQALQTIHNPPSATQQVKVSKDSQDEKRKMVSDLIPFLAMLYTHVEKFPLEESYWDILVHILAIVLETASSAASCSINIDLQ